MSEKTNYGKIICGDRVAPERAEALRHFPWSTYTENNHHATQTGLNGTEHMRNKKGSMRVLQYDADMNLIAEYPSMREAERQTGIDCASISLGVRKGWKYGGFIWKKAE